MKDNHYEEIRRTRVGGFGGSDAAMFYKIGTNGIGSLSASDLKRIDVAKGLRNPNDDFQTEAMKEGHRFEDVFEKIAIRYMNGTVLEREKRLDAPKGLETAAFKLFAHADYCTPDNETVYELKNTKHVGKAATKYEAQLQWYYLLGASEVFLVTHDATLPLDEHGTGVQIVKIERNLTVINAIVAGIGILASNWDNIPSSVSAEVTTRELLPFDEQQVMAAIDGLKRIAEIETSIEDARAAILEFMEANGILKITGEDGSTITYVGPTERKTFDKAAFKRAHPEIDLGEFDKTSRVKSSIRFSLNTLK